MGEVIRKTAAVEDIQADVAATLRNATAKGEAWSQDAEDFLRPVMTLAEDIARRLADATGAYEPLRATVRAENDRADDLLGRVYDEAWNMVGRPATDPFLDTLFPGGSSYYAEGDTEQQPERMELLAQLLESGLHPRIPAQKGTSLAEQVRQGAAALRAALNAAGPPRTQVQLLDRVRTAVARSAQVKLSGLKRVYKARGFSEAEIHTVIPDRSRPAAPAPRPVAAPPA
jgi:hypothetical protein